ncbi:MAG TPA: lmo0937 family membrane protein [Candidatus Sulfotelmatobacter sp.]
MNVLLTLTPECAHASLQGQAIQSGETTTMLWTIAVVLLILWLLGMVSSYTLGGFIHILLVLAVIAVLVRIIQGRSPV